MRILFLGKPLNWARVEAFRKHLGHSHGVIHLHGWKWASLTGLLRLIFPEAALVWTIESAPTRFTFGTQLILSQAAWAGVEMVATTRALQWRLLTRAGVRVRYIPDGYTIPRLAPISVRRFGLWKGRYCVAVAATPAEEAGVKRAYARVKTRKKLVMMRGPSGGRGEFSLFTGAAAIILTSADTAVATVLSAMESGRPIVAVAAPILEETMGVTATFVPAGAEDELTQAIALLKPKPGAKRRARAHFTWERIFAEYLPLYHRATLMVPIDSARGILKPAPGW